MSSFSEKFKSTETATEFIAVWNKVTKVDTSGAVQMAIPIGHSSHTSQHDSDASTTSHEASGPSQELSMALPSKHPLLDEDNSLVPAPKRSSTLQRSDTQPNPIDDRIQSKKIGVCVCVFVCVASYVATILKTIIYCGTMFI